MWKPVTSTSAVRRAVAHAYQLKRPTSSAPRIVASSYRSRLLYTSSAPALSSYVRLHRPSSVNTKYSSRPFASTTRMVRHLSADNQSPVNELPESTVAWQGGTCPGFEPQAYLKPFQAASTRTESDAFGEIQVSPCRAGWQRSWDSDILYRCLQTNTGAHKPKGERPEACSSSHSTFDAILQLSRGRLMMAHTEGERQVTGELQDQSAPGSNATRCGESIRYFERCRCNR
jgi:hypothetical protein